ncbi:hypothetical protein G9F72_010085 [Clostridium estertheticum]|uniref:DUF6199 family natural product biosynthesis protein n=1 Tax=Clostridium estertheticum TaxID=238834 RepID=UPI0013E98B05|nr:DUF6199 family natural product biosynthesis protein [Clostridium estertheticum]MBZ9686674.1 hypothetical protein [Clostridium estertheticum]
MPKVITIIPTIFLGFIFFYGLLNAIIPKMLWKTFESWKATKEPTNTYFMSRRIAGIITMLIVSGIFLFPYLMSKQ